MCNLYTNKASAAEIAALFQAKLPFGSNLPAGDVYPGGPGLVVREDEGARIVQGMTWGFPLPSRARSPASRSSAGRA